MIANKPVAFIATCQLARARSSARNSCQIPGHRGPSSNGRLAIHGAPILDRGDLRHQATPMKLSDYRDQIVALYFYPKDFTSGCTTEACTFRDSYAKIKKAGIVLLGCSVDTADSHRAFIKKYGLPFPLLLDPDKKIATESGVANGIAKYGFDGRATYVIGGDGRILKVYPKVDPALNASEIISQFGRGKSTLRRTRGSAPGFRGSN
jgi:thioredoxin-dependent peroxiredoxin